MIDTVKFKIGVTDSIKDSIRWYGQEFESADRFYGFKTSYGIRDSILIAPYDTPITLFSSYEPDYFYLEGSLPKVLNGENVRLLYPTQLKEVLERIYQSLLKRYGAFMPIKTWEIQKLDMCYAWKYQEGNEAKKIDYLKRLDYLRKSKHIYKSSVMYVGRVFTLKFYLKEPEFLRKDYKKLLINHSVLAEQTKLLSKGVLRFEVELRKAQLNQLFGQRKLFYTDFLEDKIFFQTLNKYLDVLLKGTNSLMLDNYVLLERLESIYTKYKSKKLFPFAVFNSMADPIGKYYIDRFYSPSTIKRYSLDLHEVRTGISMKSKSYSGYDLAIPSDFVVNRDKPFSAGAEKV